MDGLSKENTVNTAIDALSHLMEGYLSPRAGQATDALAQRGMKMIAKEFDNLAGFTLDSAARDTLLMASALGGMVIANTGTTAVHAMGYGLTYFKDVDHGRANGLLITSFLKFIYDPVSYTHLALICVGTFFLCILEPEYSFVQLLFEDISAFGTVGLSTGITPDLCDTSKVIIILTMFAGRVGTFTLLSIWVDRPAPTARYTEESITIG